MEVLSSSTQATEELAGRIAEKLKPGAILALYGDLGSGKTTFTRLLATILGFDARVQSPTFVLAREYKKSEGEISKINHLDLYRLDSVSDVEELGLYDMFSENNAITIIEWPEVIDALLPDRTIKIKFDLVSENERKINVQNLN